jgi:hypothetical protein
VKRFSDQPECIEGVLQIEVMTSERDCLTEGSSFSPPLVQGQTFFQ